MDKVVLDRIASITSYAEGENFYNFEDLLQEANGFFDDTLDNIRTGAELPEEESMTSLSPLISDCWLSDPMPISPYCGETQNDVTMELQPKVQESNDAATTEINIDSNNIGKESRPTISYLKLIESCINLDAEKTPFPQVDSEIQECDNINTEQAKAAGSIVIVLAPNDKIPAPLEPKTNRRKRPHGSRNIEENVSPCQGFEIPIIAGTSKTETISQSNAYGKRSKKTGIVKKKMHQMDLKIHPEAKGAIYSFQNRQKQKKTISYLTEKVDDLEKTVSLQRRFIKEIVGEKALDKLERDENGFSLSHS